MRVALVSPQYRVLHTPVSDLSKNVHRRAQPLLGLAILATTLSKAGHEVLYLDSAIEGIDQTIRFDEETDYYGLLPEGICKRVEAFSPDVIALTCLTTSQYPLVRAIYFDLVRLGVPIIIGGNHASLNARSVSNQGFHSVICGEADLDISDIVNRINSLPEIVSVGRLENIDSSPKIDWSLLPMEDYWTKALPQNPFPMSRKNILYETSRGCPEHCVFCSTTEFFGNRYRPKSSRRVVDEITGAVESMGIEEVQFCDDSMGVNETRFLEICEGLAPLNIHLCNPSGIRFYTKSEVQIRNIFSKMRDAGFYQMTFAVESGNEHILNTVIKKRLDLEWTRKAIGIAKDFFKVHAFFLIGLPGETEEQINDTLRYAKDIDVDSYSLSLAQPFPSTELWRMCRRGGWMKEGVGDSDMLLGKQVIRRDDGLDLVSIAESALEQLASNSHRPKCQ